MGIDNSCFNLLFFLSSTGALFVYRVACGMVLDWLCRTCTDRPDTLLVAKIRR